VGAGLGLPDDLPRGKGLSFSNSMILILMNEMILVCLILLMALLFLSICQLEADSEYSKCINLIEILA
jgi:hypothetical protein